MQALPHPTTLPAPTPTQRLRELRGLCRAALQRAERTLARRQDELAQAADHEHLQQLGDALLAVPDGLRRGLSEHELTNPHTGLAEKVQLNPKLDGRGNAELYYKKARKARRGLQTIRANVADSQATVQGLRSAEAQLAGLTQTPEGQLETGLAAAEQRLTGLGVLQARPGPAPAAPDTPRVPYRHLRFQDADIYVGRNDEQNDELTVHFARPWDVWLHVAAHRGSHVLIRREKHAAWPAQQVLAAAAGLAVWFSKAKHTSWCEVHVAEKRYVSKRRHAPAGEVVLQQYTTVRAAPLSPQELFRRFPAAGVEPHGADQ